MKKVILKVILIVLVVVLPIFAVSACGNGGGDSDGDISGNPGTLIADKYGVMRPVNAWITDGVLLSDDNYNKIENSVAYDKDYNYDYDAFSGYLFGEGGTSGLINPEVAELDGVDIGESCVYLFFIYGNQTEVYGDLSSSFELSVFDGNEISFSVDPSYLYMESMSDSEYFDYHIYSNWGGGYSFNGLEFAEGKNCNSVQTIIKVVFRKEFSGQLYVDMNITPENLDTDQVNYCSAESHYSAVEEEAIVNIDDIRISYISEEYCSAAGEIDDSKLTDNIFFKNRKLYRDGELVYDTGCYAVIDVTYTTLHYNEGTDEMYLLLCAGSHLDMNVEDVPTSNTQTWTENNVNYSKSVFKMRPDKGDTRTVRAIVRLRYVYVSSYYNQNPTVHVFMLNNEFKLSGEMHAFGSVNVEREAFKYELVNTGSDSYYKITGLEDGVYVSNKIIPEEYPVFPLGTGKTLPVKEIDDNAFSDVYFGWCDITIGKNIERIGTGAFYCAEGLEKITFLGAPKYIGPWAFYGLRNHDVILKDIASWCEVGFDYDSDISDIERHGFNPLTYASNVYIGDSLIGDVVIPEGVTSIKMYCFFNCEGITSVTLPDSLTDLGYKAFCGCSNLANISFGKGLSATGYSAFAGTAIETLTLPDTIETISYSSFYGCGKLTSLNTGKGVKRIESSAFGACSALTDIVFGENVEYICSAEGDVGVEAMTASFYNCTAIKNITIKNLSKWCGITFGKVILSNYGASVTAFRDNPLTYAENVIIEGASIEELVIPEGVTGIAQGAFANCNLIKSVVIPDSVTIINNCAFAYCKNLENIMLGAGDIKINTYAFYCSSLDAVYFKGTAAEWTTDNKPYTWDPDNLPPSVKSIVYYYSESEPTDTGNFWHYVNGKAEAWA